MLKFEKKKLVFNLNRCTQCGACIAACDNGALYTKKDGNGLYSIYVEHQKCNLCGRCVAVCPSHTLPAKKINEALWKKFTGIKLVYARELKVRQNASSGGVARVLLSGALNHGIVNLGYGLHQITEYPWSEGRFFSMPVDLETIPNSMYHPILVMKNLKPNKPLDSILLIGTTCQLIGATRLLKGKVGKIFQIAIFCKQQKTFAFTKFIAKRLGINMELTERKKVSYRGHGWPGKISIGNNSMEWEKAAALPYGKKIWRIPGCLYCPNPFGIDVDLTLADPWGIEETDTPGKTMVMVWTEQGKKLLESLDDLVIEKDIDIQSVKKSIDWEALKKRQKFVEYYAGLKVPSKVAVAAELEQIQTIIYQKILETVRLPDILYKVMAHLPDIGKII